MTNLIKYTSTLFVFLFVSTSGIISQTNPGSGLFKDNYLLSPEKEGRLDLSIDNLSFFKNNESDGDIFDGYTLPGFRLQPRVIYYPTSFVKLEAGISLLRYWGADKYPCYSYQDISEWKANSYQPGFHILPFFRAQIQPVKQMNIVLGSIYGAGNHELIEPLYNPELNLTADPECGAQILYNSRIAKVDLWANWESFTFKNDTHNEALTTGISSYLNLTNPESVFTLSLPIQAILAHRGGEIDTVTGNVSTLINAAAGLKFQFKPKGIALRTIALDVMGADYQSIHGKSVPFEHGWAFYSNLSADIWNIHLKAAFWRSSDYINIFGNPIFGNASLTLESRTFDTMNVLNPGLSYEQDFGKGIYLGAGIDFYYSPKLVAFQPSYGNLDPVKTSQSFNYSFGIYLRINPPISLKK